MDLYNYLRQYPDERGYFKEYGGAFLEEKLIPAFEEITRAYQAICHSSQFISVSFGASARSSRAVRHRYIIVNGFPPAWATAPARFI